MSLLTYESKVSDLLMQNFELGSLMMTNHDLLTYWLAPQVINGRTLLYAKIQGKYRAIYTGINTELRFSFTWRNARYFEVYSARTQDGPKEMKRY